MDRGSGVKCSARASTNTFYESEEEDFEGVGGYGGGPDHEPDLRLRCNLDVLLDALDGQVEGLEDVAEATRAALAGVKADRTDRSGQ